MNMKVLKHEGTPKVIFGLSTPIAVDAQKRPVSFGGSFTLDEKKDLLINGWYVADQPCQLAVSFNAEDCITTSFKRKDIEDRYAEYGVKTGWATKIPAAKLLACNTLHIVMDGNPQRSMVIYVK